MLTSKLTPHSRVQGTNGLRTEIQLLLADVFRGPEVRGVDTWVE